MKLNSQATLRATCMFYLFLDVGVKEEKASALDMYQRSFEPFQNQDRITARILERFLMMRAAFSFNSDKETGMLRKDAPLSAPKSVCPWAQAETSFLKDQLPHDSDLIRRLQMLCQ